MGTVIELSLAVYVLHRTCPSLSPMRITEILLSGFSFAGTIWFLSTRTGCGGHTPNFAPHLSFLPTLFSPSSNRQMLNRHPQSQMMGSHLRQRTLVPSSSPPPPLSSPPMSTSSAPPYTDEKSSIRCASTDSDCSIFSHFSLTPESEARLRAWEQEMLGTPSPSPASPSNHAKSARCWVVFKGRVPGIYDSTWVTSAEFVHVHLLIYC